MKIGIYVEHFYTAGGGEKHIGVVAEYLSQKHDVYLITKYQADKDLVAKKLGLDFSKLQLIYWPDADDDYLDKFTADYDLFINSTIFSNLINRSKRGMFLVFFPIVLHYRYPKVLKYIFFHTLNLVFGSRHNAFQLIGRHRPADKIEWRIRQERIQIVIKRKMKEFTLVFEEADLLNTLIKNVYNNEQKIDFKVEGKDLLIKHNFRKNDELTIEFDSEKLNIKKKTTQVYTHEDPYYLRLQFILFKSDSFYVDFINNVLQSFLPISFIARKLYGFYIKQRSFKRVLRSMHSYPILMANSKYTQGWIEKIYGIKSEILYPPIDVNKFETSAKENVVMSAGRFFPPKYGHNKKQLEMIKFFKKAYDENSEFKDYEYHLCGGVKDEEASQEYLKQCQEEAEGYPIHIHPNIPFDGMKELYGKAKIFWHASGYGEDDRSPDLFEHFGMTTVEAMSAGGVPIVIGKGGQTEIIREGVNGYTWLTENEIIEKTLMIIKDEVLRKKISTQAIKDSKQYSTDNMLEHLKFLLDKYKYD